ncbi:S-adenosyl-L-methionine-dependent methyltransferase [Kalaharituber pfeilii]|nr:S-adenosyl-L-methionine-dependent methyltransferase [Kalaharituber pfeilii]
MDSPIVSSALRALFHHRACLLRRTSSSLLAHRLRHNGVSIAHARALATGGGRPGRQKESEVTWQPRTLNLYQDVSEEFKRYPTVTAQDLVNRTERPRRVKMWARDFIDDSLYNPNYGYFSRQAVIFSPGTPFDFPSLLDDFEFYKVLGERYTAFEDKLDAEQGYNEVRQLWHTPTELFKPHYGHAIARYLVTNYKLSLYPYHDLVIYEMGAGNGTLMRNILDYIRDTDPDVYERTKYKVIEISPQLAELQRKTLAETYHILPVTTPMPTSSSSTGIDIETARGGGGKLSIPSDHAARVEIINKSIFQWDTYVSDPCFFLALEVFDNFAHDMIRYDYATGLPLQGMVLIDSRGDFHEFYTPELDEQATRFLALRKGARSTAWFPLSAIRSDPLWMFRSPPSPLSSLARSIRAKLPFATNLSKPEFIPTKLVQFFEILRDRFPAHRLVTADFHSLPDAVEGVNAPVVQTRYRRKTIPVSTIYVHQGYFDILFPTDFALAEDLYRALTGKLTRVMAHAEFVKRWCYTEDIRTKSGESPLMTWYQNASFMSSV